MKKLLSLILALTLAGSMLTGCASAPASSNDTSPANPASPTDSSSAAPAPVAAEKGKITFICNNLGDLSFFDNAWQGCQDIGAKYGYKTAVIEAGMDPSKYESVLLDTADGDSQYIITSSNYGWSDLVMKYAPEYPDTNFIVFDVKPDTLVEAPNVCAISYKQNEGSYLVGMVAAAMSKNNKVGACGNRDIPIINDFMTGYIAGATTYNPATKVAVSYNPVAGDAAKMQEIASAQNDIGVDVIFNVGGAAGLGIFKSAKEKGTLAIGVDSDQYVTFKSSEQPELADVIITSMLKNVGQSIINIFDRVEGGNMVWGEVTLLGIAEGGVGLSDNENYKKLVPEDVRLKIADFEGKIREGEIVPPSYFDFKDDAEFQELKNSVKP